MDDLTNASTEELDALIYGDENNAGIEQDADVNPTTEDSTEQPTEDEDTTHADESNELDEDSADDSTDEDQTDDSQEEETPDTEDEAVDEDTTEGEDKGDETDDETEVEDTVTYQPLRANGKDYPIDSIDELYKLASAGVGAQQKYQAIASYKKAITASQDAGVDLMEAVNFMANYKDNPKEAAMQLLKDNGIDPLDVDLDTVNRTAKDYSVSDNEVQMREVVEEIGESPIFPQVKELLTNKWDAESTKIFFDKPEMVKQLHAEMTPMKEGEKSIFELVSPIAEKMKMFGDARSDYEIYMEARANKVAEIQAFEAKKSSVKQTKPAVKNVESKKAKASPSRGKSTKAPQLDFTSMSDKELDAFLNKA